MALKLLMLLLVFITKNQMMMVLLGVQKLLIVKILLMTFVFLILIWVEQLHDFTLYGLMMIYLTF